MIDGTVVVDGVVHGYNSPPETYTHPVISELVVESLYRGYHKVFSPRGERRWLLDRERFVRADSDLLGGAVFDESQTDFCVYHDIPLYGLYRGGASPLWVGRELRERHPERVALFGGIWPEQEDPIGEADRLIEEDGVVGLKFYPYDIYDGAGQTVRMDDPEAVYPILEHAQKRGIRSVAVHKAVAMAGCPIQPFHPAAGFAAGGLRAAAAHSGAQGSRPRRQHRPHPRARSRGDRAGGRWGGPQRKGAGRAVERAGRNLELRANRSRRRR